MFPKGKLLALLAVFAAIGLLTASGAFSVVQADRQADVGVAGDSSALLGLEPHNASSFATTSGDEVVISLTDSDGVNSNATTLEDNTINISNNGDTQIDVEINATTVNGATVEFYNASADLQGETTSTNVSNLQGGVSASPIDTEKRHVVNDTNSATIRIGAGQQATVGIYVDTTGLNSSDAIFASNDPITVVATDTNVTSG